MLAAFGRLLWQPPAAEVRAAGLDRAGDVDSALVAAESVYSATERRRAPLAPGELIDPNSASEVELDRLPGIGPALARAIVLNRQLEGRFGTVRELERVPGLGSSTVRRLAPYTTLPPSVGPAGAPGGPVGRSSRPGTRGDKGGLDLNRATARELESLPGIGETRARAIVRWREEHGSFRNFEALLQVPGVGPATLERLRSMVYIRP